MDLPPHNKNILLVEDHADTAAGMAWVLKKAGYQVTTALSAEAALAAAEKGAFALIVGDIGMPGMDGFEMMRRLKAKFGLKGIALSGYDSAEDVSRARLAGFSELLVKPAAMPRLLSAIERHLPRG